MAEEVEQSVLKKTQEILTSVIKKPALTDKNLKRPPFRFLHDIITNVIKSSGFMKGLYTAEELSSENIKDKESKIAFLQKAVDLIALVTNESLNLKPTKIVAGHEVQKTNEFLQILGTAAKNKVDTKEAVQIVLQKLGGPNPKERRASIDKRSKNATEKSHIRSTTKTLDPAKKTSSQNSTSKESKGKESEKTRSRSKDGKTRDKEKAKDKSSRPKREDSKNRDLKKSPASSKDVRNEPQKGEKSPRKKPSGLSNGYVDDLGTKEVTDIGTVEDDDPPAANAQILNDIDKLSPSKEPQGEEVNDLRQSVETSRLEEKSQRLPSSHQSRPPSARSKRTKLDPTSARPKNGPSQELDVSGRDLLASPMQRPTSTRPSSSRPAPPRIRIRHIVENDEPTIRPETAKPVENVIVDQRLDLDDDEEDETFIVSEEPLANILEPPLMPISASQESTDEDKGSLVKQLLETKKDLEGGSQHMATKVDIDKSQMAFNRAREASSKELEQLQMFIQGVSKTAYPLGRMLDYVQEDMDSMKMEMRVWKEEHTQNLASLKREKNITESVLEPLRIQLDDIDQLVQDQIDANSALKATILRNEERIQRMLASVRRKS